MLDTPCSEVQYSARLLATHSTRMFPLHFPYRASPCAIRFQLSYTSVLSRVHTLTRLFRVFNWFTYVTAVRAWCWDYHSPTPRLRMSGAIPLLPLHAFKVSSGNLYLRLLRTWRHIITVWCLTKTITVCSSRMAEHTKSANTWMRRLRGSKSEYITDEVYKVY